MFLRVGNAVINTDQINRIWLQANVYDTEKVLIPDRKKVCIATTTGATLEAPTDSLEGLALTWFFTAATPTQISEAAARSPLSLDVVALYRRQPQL